MNKLLIIPGRLQEPASSFPEFGSPEHRRHIRRGSLISYPAAENILKELDAIRSDPPTIRPRNLIITGEPNNGKTSLVEMFFRRHPVDEQSDPNIRLVPAISIECPSDSDVSTLYSFILSAVMAPFARSARKDEKLGQILDLFPKLGVKFILIDEFHNIFDSRHRQQREFLNTLKLLSNKLRLSIIALGIPKALLGLQSDAQLTSRFSPRSLPLWRPNQDYAYFIYKLCKMIGFPKDAVEMTEGFLSKVHIMAEGLIGETREILILAAEHAIDTGSRRIDKKALDAIDWVPPKKRAMAARKT